MSAKTSIPVRKQSRVAKAPQSENKTSKLRFKSGPASTTSSSGQSSYAKTKPHILRPIQNYTGKSLSERRKENQQLVEEVAKLKENSESLEVMNKQLMEVNAQKQSQVDVLEEKNKELEKRVSLLNVKQTSTEWDYIENLGVDPISRETIEESSRDKLQRIETALTSAKKLKEELLSFNQKNAEIITSLQEVQEMLETG